MIPNVPENHHISSWDITSSDKNAALYSSLMDILEKLDIVQVDENSSSCVTLGKIVREVESVKSDGISKNVKVTFHFTETRHSIINQESAQNENSSKDKNGRTYSTGGLKSPKCNKSSSFLSKGLDSLSRKQEENGIGAKSVLKNDVEKDVNKTGAVPLALEPTDDIKKGEERGNVTVW